MDYMCTPRANAITVALSLKAFFLPVLFLQFPNKIKKEV